MKVKLNDGFKKDAKEKILYKNFFRGLGNTGNSSVVDINSVSLNSVFEDVDNRIQHNSTLCAFKDENNNKRRILKFVKEGS